MKSLQIFNKKKESSQKTAWSFIPVLFALIAVMIGPQCSAMSNPLQGKAAPSFSLRLIDGGVFNLGDHLGKRPVVLDFWAVWCPACRAALPKIAGAVSAFKDQDVVIVTVNLGDSPESVAQFLESNSLSIPVALDSTNSVGSSYHIRNIPTTVFIGRDGKVANVTVGAMSQTAFSDAVKKLL